MKVRFFQIAAALALLAPALALAERYKLFEEDGRPSRHYAALIAELKPGDVLEFDDGHSFIVNKKLGEGETTRVLAVTWEKGRIGDTAEVALRIPLFVNGETRAYIDETADGYELLKEAGVPVVEVKHSRSGQYAVVERVDVEMSFKDFISKHPIDLQNPDKITHEFLEFVERTAHLGRIGDFHPEQLAYVRGRGWMVLDWDTDLAVAGRHADAGYNVFQRFGELLEEEPKLLRKWLRLYGKVTTTVAASRRSGPKPCVAPGLKALEKTF